MYRIKFKVTGKSQTATARYKYKRFIKGRTYTIRRKLTKKQKSYARIMPGIKILSIKKILK